jgi:hypothetical protein
VSFAGSLTDLSIGGLHARVPKPRLGERNIEAGTRADFSFHLPGSSELLRATGEVLRVEPNDRDVTGQSAIGLGVQFKDAPAALRDQIGAFVNGFRHAILVVDDDEAVLRTIVRLLAKEHRVIACKSADEALPHLRKEEIAVLITDLALPGPTLDSSLRWPKSSCPSPTSRGSWSPATRRKTSRT